MLSVRCLFERVAAVGEPVHGIIARDGQVNLLSSRLLTGGQANLDPVDVVNRGRKYVRLPIPGKEGR